MTPARIALLSALILTTACGSDDDERGSGTASFEVYGEDFIEAGIPADEVADGWDITFERFLVVLGPVSVADTTAGKGATLEGTTLFDLTAAGPHEMGTTPELAARGWDSVGFDIQAASADTERHSSASEADLELMLDEGYSVYAEGEATRDDVTKTFAWGFTGTTEYRDCVEVDARGEEERLGILVSNGGVTDVQLTIHGDHLFYDDLTAENAVLRFDPIAAADDDGNADGDVTREELEAVLLVDIDEGSYGTGSASDVNTLGDFVEALTTTLGHYQGEGHCASH